MCCAQGIASAPRRDAGGDGLHPGWHAAVGDAGAPTRGQASKTGPSAKLSTMKCCTASVRHIMRGGDCLSCRWLRLRYFYSMHSQNIRSASLGRLGRMDGHVLLGGTVLDRFAAVCPPLTADDPPLSVSREIKDKQLLGLKSRPPAPPQQLGSATTNGSSKSAANKVSTAA